MSKGAGAFEVERLFQPSPASSTRPVVAVLDSYFLSGLDVADGVDSHRPDFVVPRHMRVRHTAMVDYLKSSTRLCTRCWW
jgi:hypothetical protein